MLFNFFVFPTFLNVIKVACITNCNNEHCQKKNNSKIIVLVFTESSQRVNYVGILPVTYFQAVSTVCLL